MVKKIVHVSDLHVRTFKRRDEYKEICEDFLFSVKENISSYNRDEVRIVIGLIHAPLNGFSTDLGYTFNDSEYGFYKFSINSIEDIENNGEKLLNK